MKKLCMCLTLVMACSEKDAATSAADAAGSTDTAAVIDSTVAADTPAPEDTTPIEDTAAPEDTTPPEDATVADTTPPEDTAVPTKCTAAAPKPVDGPSYKDPQSIAIYKGTLYVANRNNQPDYTAGMGFVTRIDGATLQSKTAFATSAEDPGALAVHGSDLVVVNRGKVVFDPDYVAEGSGPGSVDLFALDSESPGSVRGSIAIPWTAEAKYDSAPAGLAIVPGTDVAYVGSGTSCHVFKVDLAACELLRGPANPIVVHTGTGNQICRPYLGPDGKVFVSSFNTDQIFSLDTATDAVGATPYETNGGGFAGTSSLIYDPKGNALYYLAEVAGKIGRIDLASGKIEPEWAATGLYPLGLYFNGDTALGTINNGDNTVQRIETDGTSSIFVTLPAGSGPSDLAYEGTDLFVVLGLYHGVAKVDILTQAITVLDPPQK